MDTCSRLDFRPIHPDNVLPDSSDSLNQRSRRPGVFRNNMGPLPARRSTISTMMPPSTFPLTNTNNNTRMRNLSGGSNGSSTSSSSAGSSTLSVDNQYTSDNHFFNMDNVSSHNSQNRINAQAAQAAASHRKLDRSLSDSDSNSSSQRSVNSSRYKTESCRPFQESGSCKYGDKCQFAHGYNELRNVSRHPKYKTEPCRTFHTTGFCPYGPRCHFLHEAEGSTSSSSSSKAESSPKLSRASSHASGNTSPALSPGSDTDYSTFTYQPEQPASDFVNINKNNFNNDVQSMEHQFNSVLNFRSSAPPPPITNDNNSFGIGVFSSGNKREPKPIGSEENDIFSQVTMFNCREVGNTGNHPRPSGNSTNPFGSSSMVGPSMQTMKLDNYPSYVDTSSCWNNSGDIFSSKTRPVGPFQHSPTGSMVSTSEGSTCSDCSGSTESLCSSSGCRDLNINNGGPFSPFSNWISGF